MSRPTLIHFTKMHGAGNDYIYVDTTRFTIPDPEATAIAWSRRHHGIGSDGLVLIGRPDPEVADFSMRLFNADGSEAPMCGNASRCIGKYVYEKGLTDRTHLRLLTATGIKTLELSVDGQGMVESISVDIGIPALENPRAFLPEGPSIPEGTFVDIGNHHYVIFVDDIDAVDINSLGPKLERHPRFPLRCNIEFAEVRRDGIRMRVWERGSGVTMACGTGACATLVAAHVTGRSPRKATILMDGGNVDVEWHDDGHVWFAGGATIVYEGEAYLPEV